MKQTTRTLLVTSQGAWRKFTRAAAALALVLGFLVTINIDTINELTSEPMSKQETRKYIVKRNGPKDYYIGYELGGRFINVDWQELKPHADHSRSILQDAYDEGRLFSKQNNNHEKD